MYCKDPCILTTFLFTLFGAGDNGARRLFWFRPSLEANNRPWSRRWLRWFLWCGIINSYHLRRISQGFKCVIDNNGQKGMKMNFFILQIVVLLCLFSSFSKSLSIITRVRETQKYFPLTFLSTALFSKRDDTTVSSTLEISDPFIKHACKSCAFVYDEEKGFKKRFPPGYHNEYWRKWITFVVIFRNEIARPADVYVPSMWCGHWPICPYWKGKKIT